MKLISSIACAIFLTLNVFDAAAQNQTNSTDYKSSNEKHENTKPHKARRSWEIGLNATGIFKGLLSQGYYPYYSYNYLPQDYLLTLRKYFGPRNALFLGFSTNGSKSSTLAKDTNYSSGYSRTNELGLGFERYQHLQGRWHYYFGLNFNLNRQVNEINYYDHPLNTSKIEYSINNSSSFSIQPKLGILLRLNNRLALSTETKLVLSQSRVLSEMKYGSPYQSRSTKNESKNSSSTIYIPLEISLRLRL